MRSTKVAQALAVFGAVMALSSPARAGGVGTNCADLTNMPYDLQTTTTVMVNIGDGDTFSIGGTGTVNITDPNTNMFPNQPVGYSQDVTAANAGTWTFELNTGMPLISCGPTPAPAQNQPVPPAPDFGGAGSTNFDRTSRNQDWAIRTQLQDRLLNDGFEDGTAGGGLNLAYKSSNARPGETIIHSTEIKQALVAKSEKRRQEKERAGGGPALSLNETSEAYATLNAANTVDVWASGGVTKVDSSISGFQFDSDIYHGEVGIDYKPMDNVVAGIFFGYDDSDTDFKNVAVNTSLDGSGYTFGMYAGWRANSSLGLPIVSDVIVDALAGFGVADYDVRINGATGSFDADRQHFRLTISGVVEYALLGIPIRSLPRFGVRYIREDQDSFRDSNGTFFAARDDDVGQIFYASETFISLREDVEAYIRTETSYDFNEARAVNTTNVTLFRQDRISSMVGLGLRVTPSSGVSLRIEGQIDEIGQDDLEVYSGMARIDVRLH